MNIEFEQLSMNSRGSPQGIGTTHVSDELLNRDIDGGTTRFLHSTFPGPITPEALPMPADDRLWLHNEESLGPVTPESGQHDPEHPISGCEVWSFGRMVQDRELLPKGEVFEDKILAGLKDREKGFQGQLKQNNHGWQGCLG